jgi:hypothetical protein
MVSFDDRDALVVAVRVVTGLHRALEVEARGVGPAAARAEAGLFIVRSMTRHLLDRLIHTPPARPCTVRVAG